MNACILFMYFHPTFNGTNPQRLDSYEVNHKHQAVDLWWKLMLNKGAETDKKKWCPRYLAAVHHMYNDLLYILFHDTCVDI